jgi:hypothetical protein
MVVQAHLAAQATKDSKSQERRRKRKFLVMKIMYERGYARQEIISLRIPQRKARLQDNLGANLCRMSTPPEAGAPTI